MQQLRGESAVKPELVYPAGRFAQVVGLVPLGAYATVTGIGVFLAVTHPHEWTRGLFGFFLIGIPIALVFLAAGALVSYMTFHVLRQLVRPRPLLRLDDGGLECIVGRVWWSDVEQIRIVGYEYKDEGRTSVDEWFFLALRGGTTPLPVTAAYYDGLSDLPRMVRGGLQLPVWTRKEWAIATIRRFYRQPVSDGVDIRSRSQDFLKDASSEETPEPHD